MNVRAGAATDIGLVRDGNEDAYLVDTPLFAVADGMGGHRGGEVASRLAIDTLETVFKRGEGALADYVREANRAVFERSSVDRAVAGMGTTLTVALLEDGRARLAHVGDSRAYLFRAGELRMLTEDHTLVRRMVQQGEITEAEADRHPQRSVVTRAIGVDVSVPVDEIVVDLVPGDRLLICSDGLTSMVDDDAIAEVLGGEPDPQHAAERLVEAANQAGGVDNTTVVVLAVEDGPDGAHATATRAAPIAPRRTDPIGTPSARTTPAERPTSPRTHEPAGAHRVPTWGRIALVAALVAVALAGGIVGLRAYLDSQWYVGVSNGHVAIYEGIPTEVAGFELHHVVVETQVSATRAEQLALYRTQLPGGITAESRTEAEQIVEQIQRDVEAATQRTKPSKAGT